MLYFRLISAEMNLTLYNILRPCCSAGRVTTSSQLTCSARCCGLVTNSLSAHLTPAALSSGINVYITPHNSTLTFEHTFDNELL